MSVARSTAEAEFEKLPREFNAGMAKAYARADFLPLDDPGGSSEADFIGRLRALFGPVEGDEYVLLHRESGLIVTAWAGKSGPSYGGGMLYTEAKAALGAPPSLTAVAAAAQARAARIAADPSLTRSRPVRPSEHDVESMDLAALTAFRERELAWRRHYHDVAAGPEFARVVARLEELVASVDPVE